MRVIYPLRRRLRLVLGLWLLLTAGSRPVFAQTPACELFALDAPTPRNRGFFGSRASVSERFAIAGADVDAYGGEPGKAHIYEYVGGVWVPRQTLSAPGTVPFDAFGHHVYIDDNTALVAADNYTRPGTPALGRGVVYVYTRQGTQWVQTGLLVNPSSTITGFGWSLAKSGTDVVVGCGYNGTQNFAVHVFRQPAVPTQPWTLVATLTPPVGGVTGYDYGYSVAIQGDQLVVGALDAFSRGQSAAYFYQRNSAGTWQQSQVEIYPNQSRAGMSVALYGNYAAVGADSNGGVRIYERAAGRWRLLQTLFSPDTPGRYGFTVAMNARLLLVSNTFDNRFGSAAGVVYRYELAGGSWQLRRRYYAPQARGGDALGTWVAVDHQSNNFILGAPGRLVGGIAEAGQAFVQWAPAVLPAGPFCTDAPAVALQATATGGVWAGPGIQNAQTGLFDPAQAGPGTHQVTYALTAGGCTFRDTLRLTVTPRLRINRPPFPALSCARDTTVVLSATVAGGTWLGAGISNAQTGTFRPWLAGPGRHLITYQLPAGTLACGSQDTFSLVVRPAAVRVLSLPPTLSCARDTVLQLRATPAGGTWSGPGISNAATGLFSSAAAGPGRHRLTYRLTAAGACGGQDTVSILVRPQPVRVLSLPPTLCRTDTVLQLRATPAGGTWRGRGIADARQGVFSASAAGPGRHVLYYEAGTGACRAADSVAVVIAPVAAPALTPASPLVLRCGQLTGQLSLAQPQPAGTRFDWQYGALPGGPWQSAGADNGQPTYQAAQPGWYRVRVLRGSCAAVSPPTELRVEPQQPLTVPNVFTPNGDQVNDVFELRLQYPRTFRLQVFNRWGREVFSSVKADEFWTGAGAPAGVYYYLWRYSTDCEPAERVVKGTVTLVR
ncbi:hypothetical protein EJV47_05735 [Hymenobacter gummosus]|uniref:Gliding motility-associated C-terminal domain-containing protein n=1 Tax=Hymenobacter gummosus TaxID=1776032 RepID=A0A3S0JJV4_9BACT|nr:gliding motility-associated C-terminal domain-containing protein [Hymenobacter gummosus]RTQ52512.1 hypothetical protein EJV47_05735 [Hymenobacter gummosus]